MRAASRLESYYTCQNCGTVTPRWSGRCGSCGAWNTLVEEIQEKRTRKQNTRAAVITTLAGDLQDTVRLESGIDEFDRVTGGGITPGSALLIGGAPGIGKSTLLLQVAAALATQDTTCVFVSGEEAIGQLRLRARRLGLQKAPVHLTVETSIHNLLAALKAQKPPALLVVDSIQTMWSDMLDSAPGTVGQVRACTQELLHYGKKHNAAIILVGHVTKEGLLAGPRVIEHMVDTVLYFEGERNHQFRLLRSIKNRYGPTGELGVFEMTDTGLHSATDPASLFLEDNDTSTSGTSILAGMEGTRPMFVEIQSLCAPGLPGTPHRSTVGCDPWRLAMILAVLDTRCGLSLRDRDIYLNAAGGMKVTEPASDLAIAAALISFAKGTPLPPQCALFGEISLSGAIRPVIQTPARIREAEKLGFQTLLTPPHKNPENTSIHLVEIPHLSTLISHLTDGFP